MAQYQITVDSEILHALFMGKNQDPGVAKLLESVLNQILKAQVTEQLGAEPYERTEERKGYRNGDYPRQLTTRVGTLTLRVPRIRGGKFSTELFARYQRSEQAFFFGSDGNGGQWCLHPKGGPYHGRAVWEGVFQIHRV